jgi:hypothetical protein
MITFRISAVAVCRASACCVSPGRPRRLDGDHRLISEGPRSLAFAFGERYGRIACDVDRADGLAVPEQGRDEHRKVGQSLAHLTHRLRYVRSVGNVRIVDGLALAHGVALVHVADGARKVAVEVMFAGDEKGCLLSAIGCVMQQPVIAHQREHGLGSCKQVPERSAGSVEGQRGSMTEPPIT